MNIFTDNNDTNFQYPIKKHANELSELSLSLICKNSYVQNKIQHTILDGLFEKEL